MTKETAEQDRTEEAKTDGVLIEWNPPKPREGGLGSWDKFVGPGATSAEEYIQIGVGALIALGCVFIFWVERGTSASVLQWVFVVFLALDIGGGIVTNSTSAAKRWYHRQGHGMSKHMTFIGAHLIHIGLVALLFSTQPIMYAAVVSLLVLACAIIVLVAPLYLQRPIAVGLTMFIILIAQLPLFDMAGLNWFVPALMLKLILGHGLKEAPFQPEHR